MRTIIDQAETVPRRDTPAHHHRCKRPRLTPTEGDSPSVYHDYFRAGATAQPRNAASSTALEVACGLLSRMVEEERFGKCPDTDFILIAKVTRPTLRRENLEKSSLTSERQPAHPVFCCSSS